MPVAEAQRLTEVHRLAQSALGRKVVAQLLVIWPLLDVDDLDATFGDWLTAALLVIQAHRPLSAHLAASYVTLLRQLELPDAPAFNPIVVAEPAVEAVTTSLLVTGPVAIRAALTKGIPPARAVDNAKAGAAAAGMRHVLNGGRDTVIETTKADPHALGFSRATSGSPCAFCAMLASRGPVYRSEESGGFEAHDHCSCSAAPVYSRDQPWPAGARGFRDQWNAATKGLHGDDALNAFRRAQSSAEAE